MENHGGMMSAGKTPESSTIALWQSYLESPSSKEGELGERNDEFCLTNYLCSYLKRILTCSKMVPLSIGFCTAESGNPGRTYE
jgi:hypothetical protein